MQNAIKQFVPTPELNESFQFNDKIKAENALANLPKQMRNLGYFVQQADTPTKPVDFDQFNSNNARDGYKIYKLLHDLRLERRKYKDEQIIADVMKSGFAGSNWELARTRVDDLKDRQYHVRNLEELFK